jgi:hypothetical protein
MTMVTAINCLRPHFPPGTPRNYSPCSPPHSTATIGSTRDAKLWTLALLVSSARQADLLLAAGVPPAGVRSSSAGVATGDAQTGEVSKDPARSDGQDREDRDRASHGAPTSRGRQQSFVGWRRDG